MSTWLMPVSLSLAQEQVTPLLTIVLPEMWVKYLLLSSAILVICVPKISPLRIASGRGSLFGTGSIGGASNDEIAARILDRAENQLPLDEPYQTTKKFMGLRMEDVMRSLD
jgi:hypothetical protein